MCDVEHDPEHVVLVGGVLAFGDEVVEQVVDVVLRLRVAAVEQGGEVATAGRGAQPTLASTGLERADHGSDERVLLCGGEGPEVVAECGAAQRFHGQLRHVTRDVDGGGACGVGR